MRKLQDELFGPGYVPPAASDYDPLKAHALKAELSGSSSSGRPPADDDKEERHSCRDEEEEEEEERRLEAELRDLDSRLKKTKPRRAKK